MKLLSLVIILFSLNSFAGDECISCDSKTESLQTSSVSIQAEVSKINRALASEGLIKDDMLVCGALDMGSFGELEMELREGYNTTIIL